MADDIFLTPEEQDERARKWLKDNGPALAIGIALGLAAIFGYDQYKNSKITSAEQASALYATVVSEVSDSDLSNIDAQVTSLKGDYAGSSYAAKASLLKAKQLSISDLDAAYVELQWVVDNAKEVGLQHTARIRQAKIKLSQDDLAAAKALASHTPTDGFDSNYAELLAEISLKQGDEAAARNYYQTAIDTLPADQAGYARVLTLKLDRLPGVDAAAESKVAPIDAVEVSEVSPNTDS
jgi:predicted negative regulator of RcsB-dependent stress response